MVQFLHVKSMVKIVNASLVFLVIFLPVKAQVLYPYILNKISLYPERKKAEMAYMDVQPTIASKKCVLLLHGKNFNGYYWKEVIPFFTKLGYRVIVPDQIGWGKSDRIDLHYSFHLLASNTKQLLDSLGIKKLIVLGHSMGGILATRFSLMYPDMVEKLILENPIGLIKNAISREINAVGHIPHIEAPKKFQNIVKDFLK